MTQDLSLQHFWSHNRSRISALLPGKHHLSLSGIQTVLRWIPPHLFVILAIVSVQSGAALAKSMFPILGSTGTVFLRLTFASLLFLTFSRPRLRGYTARAYLLVILFGLTIAVMNGFFYAAIARLPLGIATTLEFSGPLTVTLISSRKLRDVLWTLFAAAGIILLTPFHGISFDILGIIFALLAGVAWGCYILLNVQVGRLFPGHTSLTIGMSVAALAFAPFGLSELPTMWAHPSLLIIAIFMAALSSVIPFILELEALRKLSKQTFGILLSLEPVMAALIGLVILGETIGLRALFAIILIVLASGGASFKKRIS